MPVAVIGTEAIRRGWRIRPHRVRLRAGRPLRFPRVDEPSKTLAAAVTDRIWPCVMLQWEWLGGLAPVRRVAVIGAEEWGTRFAARLARTGVEVELARATGDELSLEGMDLVCLAVPAAALPSVLATYGAQITGSMGVVVVSTALVPPLGTLPAAFAAERSGARAVAVLGGTAPARELLAPGASVVVASVDRGFSRQLADVLSAAELDVSTTTDVTGVELAGCAQDAAVLAAAAAAGAGAGVAGAAAGQVFAEIDALARARGGRPETFAGLAGADDLVATVVPSGSRRRAEAVESVSLLATAAREARLDAPALDGLAALLDGRIAPEQWTATVTEPPSAKRSTAIRAA